jgi:hypothetical protein
MVCIAVPQNLQIRLILWHKNHADRKVARSTRLRVEQEGLVNGGIWHSVPRAFLLKRTV